MVYRQKILNKIDGAYNMGGNEKIDLLFDRFGIIIGPLEKEALKARNLMAHGTMKTLDYERYKEIIRKSYAYRTLFHRVILKILSYNVRRQVLQVISHRDTLRPFMVGSP